MHDAQRDTRNDFTVNRDVNRVVAGLFKAETLEVHDQVTGEEGSAFGKAYVEVANDGHAFRVKGFAIFVNDADAELVVAFVFGGEANADSESAGRMNNRELASEQSVKCTLYAELALVIGGEVAKSRYLKIHDEISVCSMIGNWLAHRRRARILVLISLLFPVDQEKESSIVKYFVIFRF